MKLRKSAISLLLASTLGAASSAYAAGPHIGLLRDSGIQHVLLISIDGLHALDVARFIGSRSGFRDGGACQTWHHLLECLDARALEIQS